MTDRIKTKDILAFIQRKINERTLRQRLKTSANKKSGHATDHQKQARTDPDRKNRDKQQV
ncbi:hypothetical protein [Caldalkalibacillus salinus]|uniref:hypothetical protein n=1 Tax=Caldalkalibacillus salinus TaxID=2803787 RepID=UPI001921B35D|nr:hypothetical protein [Caldalkalibacillus salinus]